MLVTCRDHRCLTTCEKQDRQNEPTIQLDIPTGVEVHVKGIPDTYRDHRHLTICQKQYRQNEPAGQVDISYLGGGPCAGDPRHM